MVAGETVRGCIGDEVGNVRAGIVDARHTALGGGNPEPAGMIQVERPDEPRGQRVAAREKCDAAIATTSQTAFDETDPHLSKRILAKGARRVQRYAILLAIATERLGAALPSTQPVGPHVDRANPHVSA